MDFSNFKTSDWLMIGGGATMFVAAFLPWVTVRRVGAAAELNAFDFFFTGTLPWIMLAAVAVIAALLVLEQMPAGSTPWPIVLLGLTAFAAVLVLIRLLFNPLEGSSQAIGISVSRGSGMFLGAIGAIVAAAGAVQNFQASGGDLNDLKDINKLKESFGGNNTANDEMPPPPPPPSPPPAE